MGNITYAEKGRRSRAWWLQKVKKYSGQGMYTLFTAIKGKSLTYAELSEALKDLEGAGYIQRKNNPDSPKKVCYEVTSFGHRYINEHGAELIEPEDEQLPKARGAQPTNPVPPSPGLPASIPMEPKPVSTEKDERDVTDELNLPPEPAPAPKPKPAIVTPQTVERAGIKTPNPLLSLKEQVRAAFNEMLYEKYGGEITAKELIERL